MPTQPTIKTTSIIASLAVVIAASVAIAADDNPIKKAMQIAHKAPKGEKKICEKIVEGTASDEELKKTVEAYKAAVDCKPPKGDAAAFKEKFGKLLAAAEAAAAKKAGASADYKTAVNCKACHSEHKAD